MFDIIIENGRVVDGSGNPWIYADVGIQGDRIASVGKLAGAAARLVLDATDRIVCPGFIDMHSHSDVMLLANPRHEPKIMQGVTTDVIGVDGLSYAPLSAESLQMMRRYLIALNGNPDLDWSWQSVGEYLSRFDRQVAVNVAFLVPHNALRLGTIGFVDRPARADELKAMQQMLARGMAQGAVGFSTGLDYFPCRYAGREELTAVCETVSEMKGISVWHLRIRDLGLIPAVEEVIDIARDTGVKVHFSHYAASGPANRGKSETLLRIVDDAREAGLDVTFDAYPYLASSTTMLILLPRWVHEGGPDDILGRLADPAKREKICAGIHASVTGWEEIYINCEPTAKNSKYNGMSLAAAAAEAGKDVAELVCDLLLEEKLDAGFVNVIGNEDDVRNIMQHPCHITCSDGLLVGGKPNPRGWGSFARFLAVYSRELGLLRLEEMIRHMTAAPAQRLGLHDRGLVKAGLAADVVVFDPKTIRDTATFEDPTRHPAGIDYVLVNGAVAVSKGRHTGVLSGRALLRG